jgi:starch-binding outer membrane protein, SusD/RagB family
MNRSLLFTMFLIFAATGSSCSEDFLNKEPQGITAETIFTNEKGIEALLVGTFGNISGGTEPWNTRGASIQNWTFGSVASDDTYKGAALDDQPEINDIERWDVSSGFMNCLRRNIHGDIIPALEIILLVVKWTGTCRPPIII